MTTLDAALESVLCQDYCGRVQVSLFDDASTDGTAERIAHWLARLNANGFETVGFAKNRAVAQSEGAVLIFLDSDDIMLPARISQQVLALSQSPRAIVGGAWRRLPDGATAHYESWANSLSPERLWLEQFRETTLQMPTWAIRRETFARVGGFVEKPAEDLAFFLKLRVLTLPSWEAFTVWGAGRDGRQFVSALSPAARARVLALADIDPKKVPPPQPFPQPPSLSTDPPMRPPVVVCVSLRRADESAADNGCSAQPTGEIARAASELGLVEGRTVWYFF
ncbi:nucleotide-diphospho-sugar transferase [Pavlovales sp. CCMP2436]|nr:nucleotide-diphospho-sugar transferase [Pavlovales sp. CCMP2436]